jgi:4-amino-4-deoxy-L-arabinose transferase-like glycosyltransferase
VRLVDLVVLTLVLAAALAWPVASPPIGAHGEAREGMVVQDIVLNDQWVLPRRNGALPSKPPLYHWIGATAAHAIGLDDVAVRLPSALAAITMAIATFVLATAAGGRAVGWLSAGALLGMHGFWESATEARVDMVFAACVTLSLVAFFFWYRDRGRTARAVCYLAAAAAVLAKGPVGVVLPALVIVVFVAREWLTRRVTWSTIAALWSWRLAAAVVAIDAGWYLLAYWSGGREFLELHLVRENTDRFLGQGVFGMHGGRSRLALAAELATDLLPWNLVLPWAAVRWLRGAREDVAGRFLHAWWLGILAFFTVAFGKRGVYLLPLYPAVAVLAGRAIFAALGRDTATGRRLDAAAPALLARMTPAAPRIAVAAVAIIAFDVVLLLTNQLVREHRAGRKSLAPFASAVSATMPVGALVLADPDVPETDRQLLAYRLATSVARGVRPEPALAGDPVYYLVPAAEVAAARSAGYEAVAESSRRRGMNVALLRADSR